MKALYNKLFKKNHVGIDNNVVEESTNHGLSNNGSISFFINIGSLTSFKIGKQVYAHHNVLHSTITDVMITVPLERVNIIPSANNHYPFLIELVDGDN
ncbi:hypothetical protein [Chengkuizengella axinellae]|uniref:Uncharacterized protein n=1 Tax=Chengkuizengella axinellae TaxID=3064388 RepID=A0ABT9J100_9BACL|nr:hypothetical protein [Chengkuizengella sp. 2205SS18-9]MDP5275299.1 hypothetical protein [Chengkuizengella sp. 2205SS18-9]